MKRKKQGAANQVKRQKESGREREIDGDRGKERVDVTGEKEKEKENSTLNEEEESRGAAPEAKPFSVNTRVRVYSTFTPRAAEADRWTRFQTYITSLVLFSSFTSFHRRVRKYNPESGKPTTKQTTNC